MTSPPLFLPGQLTLKTLTGDEFFTIDNGGSVDLRTTTQAVANLAASFIETSIVVADVVTQDATPTVVIADDWPVIPLAGGYAWLQGTIVAHNPATGDLAIWNIALATSRAPNSANCITQGDTTPSTFTQTGTLAALTPPSLSAGASGPVITLTGIAATEISWGINLNSTTGD